MSLSKRALAAAMVVLSPLAAGTVGSASAAGHGVTGPPRPTTTAPARTVTLISGDRVTVLDPDAEQIRVEPGRGRDRVTFVTRRIAGHLHVIPADAAPLLRDDRLDDRLFDVTELLRSTRDKPDGRLSLLVTPAGDAPAAARTVSAARAALTASGAQVGVDLPGLGAFSLRASGAQLSGMWAELTGDATMRRALASGGGTKLWLDGVRRPTLDVSVPLVGAPTAWQAGYTGTGVTVAVLDSGIDATHPDLAGRVRAHQNFTDGEEDDRDLVGHGTHVASTIAGDGTASGGRFKGVAPDAQLLDGKVCTVYGCPESAILAGMQWAADQGAKVVNLSLGVSDTPEVDPLESAVGRLTDERGMLFVVAAGNSGADGTIDSPASADAALAVGAVSKSDELADFSSRGPRTGDAAIKPDLTAPGVEITAARSRDSEVGEPGQMYATMSGTSMAAPHVAGAAALLRQQHPDWTPERLKAVLLGSAKANPELDVFAQGAGRLDLARAIGQSSYATPASVSFGEQRWPHGDDQPSARTVTFHNTGTGDLALALALTTTGPGGKPAPAGMFTLSDDSLTVPAGGQASVTLTADTRVGDEDGSFSGYLSATAAGRAAVRTPFAVVREVESYDLTLSHTGRDGQPGTDFTTVVRGTGEAAESEWYVRGPESTTTLRLPRGTYVVESTTVEAESMTLLVQPAVTLTSPRRVDLDARLGAPVSVSLADRSATQLVAEATVRERVAPDSTVISGLIGTTFDGMYTARIGPDPGAGPVSTVISAKWARPGPDGTVTDSPETYHGSWITEGRMLTGFARQLTAGNLATVRDAYASQADGVLSAASGTAASPSGYRPLLGYQIPFHAPFRRVNHYNTDGGVRWQGGFMEGAGLVSTRGTSVTYEAGREYVQQWNQGVFGPVLGEVTRTGDTLLSFVGPYGDGAGRFGISQTAQQRVTLTRDGKPVPGREADGGNVTLFDVPTDEGTYRLQLDAERAAPATLSTRTSAAWTFRSARPSGGDEVPLPVWMIRFSPELDQRNAAPAGRQFAVPVTVTPQPGSAAAALRNLSVEVSYDDGRTWQRTVLLGSGGQRIAMLSHPGRDGFVSLRASAADTSGNTVEQTIVRAYRITTGG
ncbi:S8 family serine peptidase [Micromonospora sp. NPDC049559]|uniref:S8 family serine peptidase n=1 Tax=Micromonospora sp. NPDC049559 TaxID=3155923 RepID=UPI00342557F9